MRSPVHGWRTARSLLAPAAAWMPARRGVAVPAATPASFPPVAPPSGILEAYPASPFRQVRWTIPFIAILGYILAVTSYRFPIAEVSVIVGLLGVLLSGQRMRVPSLIVLLGTYLVWCIIGYAQTRYTIVVWDKLLNQARVALIMLLAANAIRTRAQVRFFLVFLLGCYAFFPVRGAFANYFIYGETLFGRAKWNQVFANPNDLASLTLLQLSIAAGLVITEPKGWVKWCAAIGVALLPLLMLFTQSRGALIALGVFTLIALIGQRRRLRAILGARRLRRVWVALAVTSVIVVLAAPKDVWERMSGLRHMTSTETLTEVDPEQSARQRFEIWKVASTIALDHPVTGVGLGAYPYAHFVYARRDVFDPIGRGFRDAHSTYLTVLAETGIPGFVIFAALVGASFVHSDRWRRRCRKHLPRASLQIFYLELGLATYLIAGIWSSVAHLAFTYLHLTIMYVVAEMHGHELRRLQQALQVQVPASQHSRTRRG